METQQDTKPETEAVSSFDAWAVVDVMGHQRYIGRVTEQVIAGCGFIRVDVPTNPDDPTSVPFSKLIGTSSIYAISPVSEEIAREMVRQRKQTPIESYSIPKLPGRVANDWDEDD